MLPIKIGARVVNRGNKDHGDGGERPEDSVHDREVDVDAPATGEGWGSGFRVGGQGKGGGGGGGAGRVGKLGPLRDTRNFTESADQ